MQLRVQMGTVLGLLLAFAVPAVPLGANEQVVETVIRGVEHREQAVASFHLLMTKEVYGLAVPGDAEPGMRRNRCLLAKIRLWADEDRFYQEVCPIASSAEHEPEAETWGTVQAYDGENRYVYSLRPGSPAHMYVGRAAPDDNSPHATGEYGYWFDLMYYYASQEYQVQSKRLRKLRPTFVRTEQIDGLECYRLERHADSGDATTWWIAPERSYVCLKRVNVDATTFAPEIIRTTARWDQLVETPQGVWLPRRLRFVKEHINGDVTYLSSALQFTITHIDTGSIGVSPVHFTFPLDSTVSCDNGEVYVVGSDTAELAERIRNGTVPEWITASF
ncbi:MAG: hypothetical protein J7M38_12370 [Armatimonadetes bacterium]|nr:hypothetical protein [Armatimonadota bacterium]